MSSTALVHSPSTSEASQLCSSCGVLRSCAQARSAEGRARACGTSAAARPAPRSGLPRLRAHSGEVPAHARFERLREAMGHTYTLDLPERLQPQDCRFDISAWRFGPLLLAGGDNAARVQSRTPQNIRNDQVDHYRLMLLLEGSMRVDSDGQVHIVRPGEMFVSDLARPENFEAEAGANRVIYIPREMLDEALPRPFDLHGARPGGVTAQLLAAQLRLLDAERLDMLAPDDVPALARATVQLLAASLVPSRDTADHALPSTQTMVLRQMSRYVDLHLGEPQLGAEDLCSFFGLSRSALYRMFEPLGGVSRYIRERRLARVHELLARSAGRVHLGSTAQAHGFRSATHFSRAFREQYGYSPGEVRLRGLTMAPDVAVALRSAGRGRPLDQWMRSLRD
ncbi:helix-turn-helix domain-containing protein [Variovorax sp. OV329]|uniref:helix-turn-helix domain-containing protein n=1 Tax=Variovorax sp. OV329 TaxID=1882825 RepID=UPI0008E87B72|nr:helix-turn-helix domain-containing protein [Variovorax sp. OV329]SFM93180.1 transcriptional regulator, AraC family [Variovorax sp. OV329]